MVLRRAASSGNRPTSLIATLSSCRQPPSELAERNSSKPRDMLGSECDLKMCVGNLGYTSPLSSPAQITCTFFRRFHNLTANLTAYIFGIKQDIHNWASALETTRGILRRLKMRWTLVHKRLHFTHCAYIMHITSLPGFAEGDQQTKLNEILPNGEL